MSDLDAYRRASPRARLGVGAALVLVLLALAVTVGIGIWRSAATPAEPVPDTPRVTSTPTVASAEMYVHVSGAVRSPGLYVVSPDARVIDAVSAAGGLSNDANSQGVNLARAVTDGEHLVVPAEGEEVPVENAGTASPLIDLNSADGAALETLSGIGPALASRIIAWREDEGPFGSVDDLLAVSGIGPSVLESVRDQVTV